MIDQEKNNNSSQKPVVKIYIRKYPFEVENKDIYPTERAYEIDDCTNEKLKGQKYYVWKLLEQALTETFGLDISDAGMKKEESKWCCSKCNFSLSHSDNVVAVAVSTNPVGIDIEEDKKDKFDIKLADKILHKEEQKLKDINLCNLWTQKEAIFKKSNRNNFVPNKINTVNEKVVLKPITIDKKHYTLCVATDYVDCVEFKIIKN